MVEGNSVVVNVATATLVPQRYSALLVILLTLVAAFRSLPMPNTHFVKADRLQKGHSLHITPGVQGLQEPAPLAAESPRSDTKVCQEEASVLTLVVPVFPLSVASLEVEDEDNKAAYGCRAE
jgi:hypothetical protein